MDLRGASEVVEKDSPPLSFVSPPGPASLNDPVPQPRRNHSHQLPLGQPGGGVARKDGRGFINTSTGIGLGSIAQSGSRFGQSPAIYPGKYPVQEAVPTSSSSHTPSPKPSTSASCSTSLTSVQDNQLEMGIDHDIVMAADDVKMQVGGEEAGQVGVVGQGDAPEDPNLVCPTCGRRFRIGQIQRFRQHAENCNNKIAI